MIYERLLSQFCKIHLRARHNEPEILYLTRASSTFAMFIALHRQRSSDSEQASNTNSCTDVHRVSASFTIWFVVGHLAISSALHCRSA